MKRTVTALVNDRPITVEPRETLLLAALRQGIEFPNSCRVGGCGTCKCRLSEGAVKELTETGYLLSGEEIERGYILACQSVPTSDVRIEVDLAATAGRGVGGHSPRRYGRVVGQERVTHDITRLRVALDEPLAYRAGQFANLSLGSLPGVTRSYSFAAPAREDGEVSFLVRQVPGGQLSSHIAERELIGDTARVDGPSGEFWLRPSDAPMVLVAGGSGLAPILAILEEAVAAGVSRPAALVFGAREERDLLALEQIASIGRRWRGTFRFVPVLSAAPADSPWRGARGLVTDHLAAVLEPGAHAYLCGPPAMIDAAVARLAALGVAREHVRFDRFTTQYDAALAASASSAEPAASAPALVSRRPRLVDALHYLKFMSFHVIGLFSAAAVVAGGARTTAGLIAVLALYVLGDAIAGDDTSTHTYRHPRLLTAQLWLALPLLALITFAAVWSVSSGDPLGFGALVTRLTGHDVLTARDATSFGHHVSAWVLTGLMIGMVGTIPAHELTHRTWDPVSMAVGRWLLSFSFDTSFAIEHVYGHHRYVSTVEDPATAPRGRNVYTHIVTSTVRGNASAWRIEAERLRKKRLGLVSWHNAVLRGAAMSALLVAAAGCLSGWRGAAFFAACALWGKGLLEVVNYMEHYGMVRDPATPVEPRHSWNTNRRISSWTMFNLTRHSHHHAQGEVPYQDLRPYPNAPMMINGYLTTLFIAMVPPLWQRLMMPKVLAWDRDHATEGERRLAAAANARVRAAVHRRRLAARAAKRCASPLLPRELVAPQRQ